MLHFTVFFVRSVLLKFAVCIKSFLFWSLLMTSFHLFCSLQIVNTKFFLLSNSIEQTWSFSIIFLYSSWCKTLDLGLCFIAYSFAWFRSVSSLFEWARPYPFSDHEYKAQIVVWTYYRGWVSWHVDDNFSYVTV